MSYRSNALLRAAQGQRCMYCGREDGTTVAAHIRSVALGSGTGIKAPDCYVAYLCYLCYSQVDGQSGRLTKEERDAMWMQAYLRTVAFWFDTGLVTVTKK